MIYLKFQPQLRCHALLRLPFFLRISGASTTGIDYLGGYFESMERINAISVSAETVKASLKEHWVANGLSVPLETAPNLFASCPECPSL